jgi:hypothetical protein
MLIVALFAANALSVSAATPDPVLEWIGIMNSTVIAGGTTPNVTSSRVVPLVSASVFDAVNGIEPRFRPLLVRPDAPHDASRGAAAIQAAYAILLDLYPAQSGTLTTQAECIARGPRVDRKSRIDRGGRRLGTNCCGRCLGLTAYRRVHACASAISWRAGHRRNTGCRGRLASHAAR